MCVNSPSKSCSRYRRVLRGSSLPKHHLCPVSVSLLHVAYRLHSACMCGCQAQRESSVVVQERKGGRGLELGCGKGGCDGADHTYSCTQYGGPAPASAAADNSLYISSAAWTEPHMPRKWQSGGRWEGRGGMSWQHPRHGRQSGGAGGRAGQAGVVSTCRRARPFSNSLRLAHRMPS